MGTSAPVPAGTQVPRTRSSRPAVDPEGFFNIVEEAFQIHLDSIQWPADSRPFFKQEFPKEKLTSPDCPFEGIVFKLVSSVPASRSNDGSTSRKPIIFDEPDPVNAGYTKKTSTWWELITFQFTVYARSNPRRSALTTWFHKFILRYGNALKFFESRGCDQLDFVGRGPDSFESHEQQDVYAGYLTYQIRVQFLDTFTERNFDQVTIRVDTAAANSTTTLPA